MSGVTSRPSAADFCRLFAKQDTNTRIDGSWFGIFKLGDTPTATAAGQVDGGGIPLTGSRTNALEVNADTGSTALSGDYYVSAIKGNLVHGTADTNSSEVAVLGALNNNTATFGSGDKYAVRGHLDLWGITNLTGANVNVGAVSAYVENEAVPVVDSGNVLCGLQAYQVTYKPTVGSGVFPARGINPALWIRASGAAAAWQTGIYMPVNSVETGIRIGNWVAAGASGSAIPFATAQNVYADGQLSVVAAFGESTSNLTSAYNAHVGRFRHIATGTSLTVAQETYGLVGQMCAKGATMTHLHAGLMGTFEGTGASVVCNSSYTMGGHAAVTARVGGHANITATTPLAGFLAFNNAAAAVAAGTLSAFATSAASSSYPWGYGLYMPSGSVKQAMYAVSALTGASSLNANELTVNDATTMTDGYSHAVHVTYNKTGTTAGTGCSVSQFNGVGVDYTITGGGGASGYYGLYCYLTESGTTTLSSSAVFGANLEVTEVGATDYIGCLWLNKYNTTAGNLDTFILMSNQGSGATTAGFYFQGTKPTYFLQFASADGFLAADTSNLPAAATYKIKCRVGSTDFYLIGVADF